MDRRGYLTGIATTAALGVAGCGGSGESSTPTGSQLQGPTEEDSSTVDLQYREWTDGEVETVKSDASQLESYDDLARNAEDRAGEYISFNAIVLQNLEAENYSALLLSLDNAGSQTAYGSWTGDRFLDGDVVTVWAEVLGTETYETAGAGQRTVPALALADVELVVNQTSTA